MLDVYAGDCGNREKVYLSLREALKCSPGVFELDLGQLKTGWIQ